MRTNRKAPRFHPAIKGAIWVLALGGCLSGLFILSRQRQEEDLEPMAPNDSREPEVSPNEASTITLESNFLNKWSATKLTSHDPGKIRIKNAYRTRFFWVKGSFSKPLPGFGMVVEQNIPQNTLWRPEVLWQAFDHLPPFRTAFASGSILGQENLATQILNLPPSALLTESANITLAVKIGLKHPELGRQEAETATIRLRSLKGNLSKLKQKSITVYLGEAQPRPHQEWVGVWNSLTPNQAPKKLILNKGNPLLDQELDSLFAQLSQHHDFLIKTETGDPL